MVNIFVYGLALIVPLIFLGIIRKFDFYQTGQFSLILLCLCWGAIAYAPASSINWYLNNSGLVYQHTIDHFIAPILEEVFKGLILIYLVRRSRFTYSVDGALYGFAVGIGFAIFENLENVLPAQSMIDIIIRILSTNLIHAFSSAAIGIALGIFRLGTSRLRWLISMGGVLVAIGQHMLFNTMEPEFSPIATIIPGFLGMFFIYVVMQRGKKQARIWIKEKLGMEDRVTHNEVTAVDRLANADDALLPVFKRFGVETTSQVEKLLYLQARIGIKSKALDGLRGNDKIYKAVETEINKMRSEMKRIQGEIGSYAMLFVRGLFTDEMASVWEQMQNKIKERSAATGGQKGGGLWLSLEERLKSSTADGRLE